ncbi:MAG: phosphoenolpyruvate--protein phosphotransferase [Candidatus Aminicenantales bacterium]
MDFTRLRGIGVSPGIAMGEAVLTERIIFTSRKEYIPPHRVEEEMQRLKAAIAKTRENLVALKDMIREKIGEEYTFIFDAHLLILDDQSLAAGLEKLIREENVKSESALSEIHGRYQKIFDAISDEYFKQRKSDVADVLAKIYRNLASPGEENVDDTREKILVAHDLLPSEAALRLSHGNVLAVALDMGGATSHAAILARSLNIPTVVGLHDITQKIKSRDVLIVDGTDGEVIINPPLTIQKEFQSKREKYDNYRKDLKKVAKWKAVTLDDVRFALMANIELPEEIKHAISYGAEGVGLFRSEFIYLQRSTLPSEEDHFEVYARLAKEVHPYPVYIRTIDIGGEKNLPQLSIEKEPNPALGLRAIRFSLQNRELFRIQLRAILRASVHGNVRILIPMITELEEIGEVKIMLREVQRELEDKKIKFDRNVPLGIMIEVPAAAAIADILVKEVDYFSIGTNDLVQYDLAVDRSNEFVSYLYKPFHPSVLRLVKFVIESALKEGKDVAVCGEMAANPLAAMILLGLGLRKFSMNPIFIPRIKKALRSVEFRTVRRVVHQALALRTAQDVEEVLTEKLLLKYPDAFLMMGP